MSRHRQEDLRPRYGRISVLGVALAVTGIAVLGGTGVLPSAADDGGGRSPAALSNAAAPQNAVDPTTDPTADPTPAATPGAEGGETGAPDPTTDPTASDSTAPVDTTPVDPQLDETLPADSGEGRRIVFSEGRQRVWLVEEGDAVQRTYLVSGSIYDNLDPGSYDVYSRSEQAYGIDDSGTMKYFVRFTQGDNAAIGFHDIPIDDGKLVQTRAELGTPLSHGCIRQKRPDAIALWDFAPIGTSVVVTA